MMVLSAKKQPNTLKTFLCTHSSCFVGCVKRNLVKDGTSGHSLVENPVLLLLDAIQRVQEKGHEPNFANNSALIHAAVFGFIKEQTKRGWSEHTSDAEYQEAVKIARQFFLRLREQLQWRPRR